MATGVGRHRGFFCRCLRASRWGVSFGLIPRLRSDCLLGGLGFPACWYEYQCERNEGNRLKSVVIHDVIPCPGWGLRILSQSRPRASTWCHAAERAWGVASENRPIPCQGFPTCGRHRSADCRLRGKPMSTPPVDSVPISRRSAWIRIGMERLDFIDPVAGRACPAGLSQVFRKIARYALGVRRRLHL